MPLLKPSLPPYDVGEWLKKPYHERQRMVCQAWALQGYGTPSLIYVVYALKVVLYVGMWCFFCSFTPGMGGVSALMNWWSAPIAFQKAVVWSIAFEGLGLGCGSGPLTGRYFPPLGGALYFARPGTIKMPLFPGIPIFGGDRRTILDAALYIVHYGFLFRTLTAPTLSPSYFIPTLILLVALGVTDKTIFLASRAEHYGSALVCFLFPGDWLAGSKILWLSVWLWAATSKLNRHFPYVLTVMQSNNPLTSLGTMRRHLFKNYPHDLRPAKIAHFMAHMGTLTEYTFPLVLLFSRGGVGTMVGLAIMLVFHTFITASVPMGVPIEWNFIMVYGAFFLFGHHAAISGLSISSPALIAYLVLACVVMQVVGNFFPSRVSFLCSMRYYAGNWAYSVWLFKRGSSQKLDEFLVKSSPHVNAQLARFYESDVIEALLSKVAAFRAMHLHGRALHALLPKAVDDIEGYEVLDGELVAGLALGWNFGDGHLHDQQLLRAIQARCHFSEGDLRCIFVEAQPMGTPRLAWTIADAATGVRETGSVSVASLCELQPWPENVATPVTLVGKVDVEAATS